MLGWHWILDALDCDVAALCDREALARALVEVPDALGLTRVSQPQLFEHRDGPDGARTLAGVILLAESHFSLHARPHLGALHADLFSCVPFPASAARDALRRYYPFTRATEQVLHRGEGRR
ncbi:MAG: S-adenosylmethionine decarboxylase [Myxococcaceae bacterium]|nr:S-adenosylmethionine decarboxylase [Myxococcaceae bacterium]